MPHRDSPFSDGHDSDADDWKGRMPASGRFAPPKLSNYLGLGTAAIVFGAVIFGWVIYRQFVIDVPKEQIAILIKKEGADLENSDVVAPDEDHRGVQRLVL